MLNTINFQSKIYCPDEKKNFKRDSILTIKKKIQQKSNSEPFKKADFYVTLCSSITFLKVNSILLNHDIWAGKTVLKFSLRQ